MTKTPEFTVDPTLKSSWTADDELPAEITDALAKEVHVVLPMVAWDELEFLADHFPEQVLEQTGGEIEGEDEGEWWVFYCSKITVDQLLELILTAIPSGWTADIVPVPDSDLAAARIEVSHR